MKIINLTHDSMDLVVQTIHKGGVVVFPSDTVYGLLCDATNEQAVKKLIEIKNRPWGKPISVFVDGFPMIRRLVKFGKNKHTLESFLPGPFTVILPSRHKVVTLLESERGTLGVRLPQYSLLIELVKKVGKPVTATSANISGRSPHYTVSGYLKELSSKKKELLSLVCDYGKLPRHKPSTIVDLTKDKLHLLRKGDIVPHSHTREFTTSTARETQRYARYILEQMLFNIRTDKPLIFIIQGEMGVGKTVFAKGLGEALGVTDIFSQTNVVYFDYKVTHKKLEKFVHADLFNIETKEEFDYLAMEQYLKSKTIWCVEWGEKIGSIFYVIKKHAKVIFVRMSYININKRRIQISD